MTNRQQNKLTAADATSAELEASKETWKNSVVLTRDAAALNDIRDSIRGHGKVQVVKTNGATIAKGNARDTAIKDGLQVADNIQLYAEDVKDAKLESDLHFTFTKLEVMSDIDLYTTLDFIYETAVNLGDKLSDYDTDEAVLQEFADSIQAFKTTVREPRSIQVEAHVATLSMAQAFALLDNIMRRLKKLVANYRKKDPAFVARFAAATRVINRGTHHNPVTPEKDASATPAA